MSEQLLNVVNHTVTSTMSGKSREEVIGKIFNVLRKQVHKEIGKTIIQMDTNEVFFEKEEIQEKKEKFLFLFMPRIKKTYTITARVNITVKYLDFEKEDN